MKRREFLRNAAPAATILPALINGFSVKAFGEGSAMMELLANPTTSTDHVLVLIQLNGGNDGLNMVVPLDLYSEYNNARTNISIPNASILRLNGYDKSGLNPAMTGMQRMYNDGLLKVIQGAGYPAPSFSHFRATDIWMSASDSNQAVNSGWMGRYLNYEYPNFPNGYPNATDTDPLAIQIGSVTSLTLQGPAVSMGMSISNPSTFYNLINGVQDPVPNTPAGDELAFVRQVVKQTQKYSDIIKTSYNQGTNLTTYPAQNSLGDQLKIVARLIKGGLKTRVYMVNFGGFDTHATQVNALDHSTGTHATLLGRVSDAIKAFQDDLKALSIDDRVMGLTFSEFGRRIKSNASNGTDHGAAAPMFVFGKNVMPGVLGNTPNIPANATFNDNVAMQYDFRSVYATLLENWLCIPRGAFQQIMLKTPTDAALQTLPLVNAGQCKIINPSQSGDKLIDNYPNPFSQETTIRFRTSGGHTSIQVFDTMGRALALLTDKDYAPGSYTIKWNSGALPYGVYYARLQNGVDGQVCTMLKQR